MFYIILSYIILNYLNVLKGNCRKAPRRPAGRIPLLLSIINKAAGNEELQLITNIT